MNEHKSACLLLVVAICGMLYGVNTLRNATSDARNLAEEMRASAESAEQQAQIAMIQMKTLEANTAELRSVYAEWRQHFAAYRSPQDAEQRIAEVIRDGDVFLISQRFGTREVDRNGLVKSAVVADLVVEDDYAKALNWLGKLEEAIPMSRITRCNLKRGDRGNDIHLELQLQIPVLEG